MAAKTSHTARTVGMHFPFKFLFAALMDDYLGADPGGEDLRL